MATRILHLWVLATAGIVVSVLASCAVPAKIKANQQSAIEDPLRIGGTGPALVVIPAGSFSMGDTTGDGDSDERPVHRVQVSAPFAIGRVEVTVAEFRRFVDDAQYRTEAENAGGCRVLGGNDWRDPSYTQTDQFPVVCVSWNDANAYTAWLSEQTGQRYRLPTEAEWEYVARAGESARYWWGEQAMSDHAHCWDCATHARYSKAMPVGQFAPNAFGVYDTSGNVWEWTASEYAVPYNGSEVHASRSTSQQGERAIRGGSWFNGLIDLRNSNRGAVSPDDRYISLGFRVARDIQRER